MQARIANPATQSSIETESKGAYLVVLLLVGLGRLQGLGLPSCNRTAPRNQPSEPEGRETKIGTGQQRPRGEGGTEQRNAPCFDMADEETLGAMRRGERRGR
jgi:hypothetical protein